MELRIRITFLSQQITFSDLQKMQSDLANGNSPAPLLRNALELLRSKSASWELVRMNVGKGN